MPLGGHAVMRRRVLALLVFALSLTQPAWATVKFLEPGGDATFDLTFWGGGSGGTVATATDVVNTGTHSLKFQTTATPADANLWTTNGTLADAGRRISVWWRGDTRPGLNGQSIITLATANHANFVCAVQMNTNGTLTLFPNGATAATGTNPLQVNTWYRLTFSYTVTNTTTFQFKLFINGTLEATSNAGTLATTGTSQLQLQTDSGFGANVISWFDDVYVDDGATLDDPGNIHVTAKRPFANGTLNGWGILFGSAGPYGSGRAQYVNNEPLDTTSGITNNGTGPATQEFTIEAVAVGDVGLTNATLVGVRGWVYGDSTPDSTGNIIVDGTQTAIALTATKTLFAQNSATPTVYPAGTGADIGAVTTAADVITHLYEGGVLVAYIPSSANFRTLLGVGRDIVRAGPPVIPWLRRVARLEAPPSRVGVWSRRQAA